MVGTVSHTDESKKQGDIGGFQGNEIYGREKMIWQLKSQLQIFKFQTLQLTP